MIPSPASAGFALSEILLVAVITLTLSGLILPLYSAMSHGSRHHASCSNYQRQVLLAMNVYANDNDQLWPVFPATSAGDFTPYGSPEFDPTATAIASCEFLASTTGGDLTQKSFGCPQKPLARPATPAEDISWQKPGRSRWAAAGPRWFGFSYDWSAPKDSAGARVILADRDQSTHGGRLVIAAFGDGHVTSITSTAEGFINRDSGSDDIYTAVGDGPMHWPGEGSTTRAFVR